MQSAQRVITRAEPGPREKSANLPGAAWPSGGAGQPAQDLARAPPGQGEPWLASQRSPCAPPRTLLSAAGSHWHSGASPAASPGRKGYRQPIGAWGGAGIGSTANGLHTRRANAMWEKARRQVAAKAAPTGIVVWRRDRGMAALRL